MFVDRASASARTTSGPRTACRSGDSARPLAGRLPSVALGLVVAAALVAASCTELRQEDEVAREPANPCTACHGSVRPGSPEQQAAPPIDIDGHTESWRPGVGAHQIHLTATPTHGPVACDQCHVVPLAADSPGHADSARPAEFTPGLVANLAGTTPRYDPAEGSCAEVYCHGDAEPVWTSPRSSAQACGSCHTLPPPVPHEQSVYCVDCHGAVIGPGLAFVDPSRHVNGGVDVVGECYDCHGTPASFAPPPDLSGEIDVSSIGVGVHQAHLTGGGSSRPVPCEACHNYPDEVGAVGHLDPSPYAEVIFGDIAVLRERQPVWDRDQRSCSATYCHGPGSAEESSSPAWTRAATTPLSCTACHGMPPPPPHSEGEDCAGCHGSVVSGRPGEVVVDHPELHVNGQIEL